MELLVVVAIIGILSSVGIPLFNGYIESTKASSTKINHQNLTKATSVYAAKCLTNGKIQLKLSWNPHRLITHTCSGASWSQTLQLANAIYQHFRSEYHEMRNWSNPYASGYQENPSWNNGCPSEVGQTSIYPDSQTSIGIWTRTKDGSCLTASIPTNL
jgi:type II secretory pathway pseudopilin PulG